MLTGQDEAQKIAEKTEISTENESELDDIKEEKAKASEEKLFHKHKKSKPKSSFFI